MLFTSWSFFLFALVTFVLFYAFKHPVVQLLVLIVSGLVFCAFEEPILLPLLFLSVGGSYLILWKSLNGRNGMRWLTLGIALNLALLAAFKYKGLILGASVREVAPAWMMGFLTLPIPIGISFFTFHNISMMVDLRKLKHRFGVTGFMESLLYVSFFPQLVSGPITRAENFFPQIQQKLMRDIPWKEVVRTLIVGYFMKNFVANNLHPFTVNMEPGLMAKLGGVDRFYLLLLYSCQIFGDFFGYSSIAVGLGLIFGYRLPENFNRPYMSTSFADFWGRWHISLSTWLKRYLYIPLGGNRISEGRTAFNLMVVMGLGGLWHGAGLSYLFWGLFHGLLLVLERFLFPATHASGWRRTLRILFVFGAVSFAWLLFKLSNFDHFVAYMKGFSNFHTRLSPMFYALSFLYAIPVLIFHVWPSLPGATLRKRVEPFVLGTMLYLSFFEAGRGVPFIYFQF